MNTRIEKIKHLLDKINELCTDDNCYSSFKKLVYQIQQELSALIKEEPDENKKVTYEVALTQLNHTDNKEVEYIKYHQDLTHKRNAAKIRRREYFNSIEQAVSQIECDIYFVKND